MSEKPECDVSSSPHHRGEDSESEYSPRPSKSREVSAACNGATSKDAQLDQSGTTQLSMDKTGIAGCYVSIKVSRTIVN